MSDQDSEKKEKNEKGVSRRKFLKAGAIAGGAAVAGLTLGIPSLAQAVAGTSSTSSSSSTATSNLAVSFDDYNSVPGVSPSYNYKPQERWYFLYATDGVSLLPTDKFISDATRRYIYMYGFTTPMSWTKPLGWSKGKVGSPGVGPPTIDDLRSAFADLNWIDPDTHQPIMRGKAMNIGPPIWGVEGDVLDITLFNAGFAFGSGVIDPHTIHLHGVHAPTVYDGIPEISFGVPMWSPYDMATDGTMILPTATGPATTFHPATDENLTQGGQSGNVFTYRMYCERPGTYLYHCHVEASEHVHMGMYGPLWVYPKYYGNSQKGGAAYNNSLTEFSQEAVMLLSDIDSRWHDNILDMSQATTEPSPYTFVPPAVSAPDIVNFQIPNYYPNYWTINGRCLPDTLLAGKWNQAYQPSLLFSGTPTTTNILNSVAQQLTYYGPASGIAPTRAAGAPAGWPSVPDGAIFFPPRQPVQTYVVTSVAEKVLVRLHNAGFQAQPMHFHGVMPNIVGKDTFAWVPQLNSMFSTVIDERRRMYTIGVFSGENYDAILAYPDKAAISPKVYGTIINSNASMPYGTSEIGQPPVPPFPPIDLGTYPTAVALGGSPPSKADYGDVVYVLDPSLNQHMVLGPGAIVPATGQFVNGTGVPGAAGMGFGADMATGYKTGYPMLYLWHAHDDYKVTNNGAYPGGAVVVVKVQPQGTTKPTASIPVNLIAR